MEDRDSENDGWVFPPLRILGESSNRSYVCGCGFCWGIITISTHPSAVRPFPQILAEVFDFKSPLRLLGYIFQGHRCSVVQGMGCFRSPVHLRRFGDWLSHLLRLFGTPMYTGTQARRAFTTATSKVPSESHHTIRVHAGRLVERSRGSQLAYLRSTSDLGRPPRSVNRWSILSSSSRDASAMNQTLLESPPIQPLRSLRRGYHPL